MSNEAYIIGAVRSPTGKKKGTLANIHAADLGAHAIRALMERTGVDPGAVDDVIFSSVVPARGVSSWLRPLSGAISRV